MQRIEEIINQYLEKKRIFDDNWRCLLNLKEYLAGFLNNYGSLILDIFANSLVIAEFLRRIKENRTRKKKIQYF